MVSDPVRRHDRSPSRDDLRSDPKLAFHRGIRTLGRLSPEGRDAFLYACSAVFALWTAFAVGIPLYRQWGQLAVGPYAAAAALTATLCAVRRRKGRTGRSRRAEKATRIAAFVVVLFGATVVPLALEVVWRSQGNPALHVQPEVVVVEQAGARAAGGADPYRVVDRNGHVVIHQHTEPTYELYYPYLPGMVLFGLSSVAKGEPRLTDARIQFLVFTALVGLVALSRLRPATDARTRALQVLLVLPTAALPLATGGDDMPVVALMLAGMVALQRRKPLIAGLALGAASALKFTAWPLVLFGLFAARDLSGRRALGRYALGVAALCGPAVLPLAALNPSAFLDNVVRYPLGLAGVSSPAASALPGHILVAIMPGAHRAYVLVLAVVGCAALLWHLRRDPPADAAGVASLTGWVMLIAILLAPATRVGYLLYPINLFVWSWMLRRSETPPAPSAHRGHETIAATTAATRDDGEEEKAPVLWGAQLSSGSSKTSTENGVTPPEVVGDATAPTSQ